LTKPAFSFDIEEERDKYNEEEGENSSVRAAMSEATGEARSPKMVKGRAETNTTASGRAACLETENNSAGITVQAHLL
jgi:hypothetical protein